jgi:Fe-S oxidoreductase
VYALRYDEETCSKCETLDCLTKCQHIELGLKEAREERQKILHGEDSRVLSDCLTCYACEEYCPYENHPFYLIVDRQEEKGIWPAPIPITKQQVVMMAPRGRIEPQKVQKPVVNMCYFPMLTDCVRGKLFEGASIIVGSDIFCNIMWLHFARNSVIRERLPQVIDNIWTYYLKQSGVDELICFHDECYGAYTHLAPAFGIQVPFKSIHLFEYLTRRLDALKAHIRPLGMKVAYQRPCSNRLVPETQHWVDDIFQRIGVERVEREYDGENALCCGGVLRAQQREELADDLLERNLSDMKASGASVCVFNCPFCLFSMGEAVAERGMMPILMSELCHFALGEGKMMGG